MGLFIAALYSARVRWRSCSGPGRLRVCVVRGLRVVELYNAAGTLATLCAGVCTTGVCIQGPCGWDRGCMLAKL